MHYKTDIQFKMTNQQSIRIICICITVNLGHEVDC